MLKSLIKTLNALQHRYLWKLIVFSAIIAIIILVMFVSVTGYLLTFLDFGESWLPFLGSGIAGVLSYFLLPVTFPLITTLFLDSVVTHIEEQHYVDVGESTPAPLSRTIPGAIKFIGISLFLNILLLPFLFFPPLWFVLYYLMNGYLFGREYFELIAFRYKGSKDAKKFRKQYRFTLIIGGILITIAFTTPILNLIAPILAAVFMVHMYHFLRTCSKSLAL